MTPDWTAAHGAFEEARARVRALGDGGRCPDDVMTNATSACFDALMAMFATPSPTIRELAVKIAVLADELEAFEPDTDMIGFVVADSARLAAEVA